MKYICISGQMRAGKNVAGSHLCSLLGFSEASFAKPVKDIFCSAFCVNSEFVERWKVIDEPPPGFTKTVRETLQFIGDGFRQANPNVWVDYAFANNPLKSCYTDGRYINELRRVKSEGGVNILLRRPSHENNCKNESEAQIKRLVDWFVVNEVPEGYVGSKLQSAPDGCELIDFFIVNDGDVPSFYSKLDKLVVPKISRREKANFCEQSSIL